MGNEALQFWRVEFFSVCREQLNSVKDIFDRDVFFVCLYFDCRNVKGVVYKSNLIIVFNDAGFYLFSREARRVNWMHYNAHF